MPVSRRKIKPPTISKTGVELTTCYCRKCMQNKKPGEFYTAVDLFLDSNGYMSICKSCCNDIFNTIHVTEKDVSKALLQTCRFLNIKYDEVALASALSHVEKQNEKGIDIKDIFGIYKTKLVSTNRMGFQSSSNMDITFVEPSFGTICNTESDEYEITDLKQVWGSNWSKEDYEYLEKEYADWSKTHPTDTKGEQTMIREVCLKMLEIRNKRNLREPTAGLVKELQELMKTAGVDASKATASNSGKSHESFSNFVKIIENNEPADYYKDKELFKDFDNIGVYFKKYITRPIKNFITGSRDFNVNMEDDESDEEFEEDTFDISSLASESLAPPEKMG